MIMNFTLIYPNSEKVVRNFNCFANDFNSDFFQLHLLYFSILKYSGYSLDN